MAKASFKKTGTAAAKTRVRTTTEPDAPKARVAVDSIAATSRSITGAAEVDISDVPKVTVKVPRAFKLTDDGHEVHDYPAGTYEMPQTHAEHPYSAANGVEIIED